MVVCRVAMAGAALMRQCQELGNDATAGDRTSCRTVAVTKQKQSNTHHYLQSVHVTMLSCDTEKGSYLSQHVRV